jgi:hypothetical protein
MTDKLCKMLISRFPPLPSGAKRVTTYYGVERIHLSLIDRSFLDLEEPLVEPRIIEDIAKRLFDVDFRFYKHQEEGDIILFSPRGIDDYNNRYAGHHIAIEQNPHMFPTITFSTGNRGAATLSDRQRSKYYHFGLCMNDTLLEMARKK